MCIAMHSDIQRTLLAGVLGSSLFPDSCDSAALGK
jgi:hypothetical protein